jgi:glycosyltransferase involved in cell wall biosynthesis
MVSSEDACQDFREFYKVRSNRMHVVRFSVPVKCEPFDRAALLGKYGLPENFFYLPNQFWRHKNHDCVIQALALAKQKGSNITVAVSGNPHDPRDPEHFQNLMKLSERLGVRNNFKVLGMIPYSDVQGLMQSCNALINPSCFEGWSTTVEEAKALGIKMLLSNLNVHQEQAGNRAEYFETDSPEELARLLSEYDSNPPRSFSNKQHEIVETSELQMARYANEFASMLKSVIKK